MIDASWYERPEGMAAHEAAGGVIVRAEGDRLYVAGVSEGDLSTYILPKGHVEPGEDVEVTARREIQEEAGLTDLMLLADLGVRERLDFRKTGWKITRYYLYLTRQSDAKPTDPKHDYALRWFPLDEPPPLLWPEQRELIETNRERIAELVRPHLR